MHCSKFHSDQQPDLLIIALLWAKGRKDRRGDSEKIPLSHSFLDFPVKNAIKVSLSSKDRTVFKTGH